MASLENFLKNLGDPLENIFVFLFKLFSIFPAVFVFFLPLYLSSCQNATILAYQY